MLIFPLATFIVLQPCSCSDILCWQIYGILKWLCWVRVTLHACKHFYYYKKKKKGETFDLTVPLFSFKHDCVTGREHFLVILVSPWIFWCAKFSQRQRILQVLIVTEEKMVKWLPCPNHLHGFFYDCFLIFYSKEVWGITSSKGCVPPPALIPC